MTPLEASCDLVLEPDDILAAVDEGIDGLDRTAALEHLERCLPCREIVRLRSVARRAWKAEPDVVAPASSARSRHPRPTTGQRAWTVRPRRLLALGGALAFVACVLVIGTRSSAPSTAPGSSLAVAPAHAPSPGESAGGAARSGAAGATGGGVAAPAASNLPSRARMVRMENIVVPEGSRISLGFAIGADAVDEEAGARAEIVGPATARAPANDPSSLTLERGTLKLQGVRSFAILVPGAKVEPNGAACTVTVDERRIARVVVEGGHAIVTPSASTTMPPLTIDAGGSLQLDPDGGVHVRPPEPSADEGAKANANANASANASDPTPARPPATTAPLTPKRTTRVEAPPPAPLASRLPGAGPIAEGERNPRVDLERLAGSSDPQVARRAIFTLAEMDLASGARDQGRARLETLVSCPDAALGADAATLLARSLGTPADRDRVWVRYLATNPPSPYRERALLDRGEALLDAGNTRAALDLCAEVRRAPRLTEPQKRQLDRLTARAR